MGEAANGDFNSIQRCLDTLLCSEDAHFPGAINRPGTWQHLNEIKSWLCLSPAVWLGHADLYYVVFNLLSSSLSKHTFSAFATVFWTRQRQERCVKQNTKHARERAGSKFQILQRFVIINLQPGVNTPPPSRSEIQPRNKGVWILCMRHFVHIIMHIPHSFCCLLPWQLHSVFRVNVYVIITSRIDGTIWVNRWESEWVNTWVFTSR